MVLIALMLVDATLWATIQIRIFRPLRPLLLVVSHPQLLKTARLVVLSTARLWPIFFLLALSISYFALGITFWFGADTCECIEPECNATQREPLAEGVRCVERLVSLLPIRGVDRAVCHNLARHDGGLGVGG